MRAIGTGNKLWGVVALAAVMVFVGLRTPTVVDPLRPDLARELKRHPYSLFGLRQWSRQVLMRWTGSAVPELESLLSFHRNLRQVGLDHEHEPQLRQLYRRVVHRLDKKLRARSQLGDKKAVERREEELLQALMGALRLGAFESFSEWAWEQALFLHHWDLAAQIDCSRYRRTRRLCLTSDSRPSLRLLTGRCLLAQGAWEQALPLLTDVLPFRQTRTEAAYLLGLALDDADPAGARALFLQSRGWGEHLEASRRLSQETYRGILLETPLPAGSQLQLRTFGVWPAVLESVDSASILDFSRHRFVRHEEELVIELGFVATGVLRGDMPFVLVFEQGEKQERFPLRYRSLSRRAGELVTATGRLRINPWIPEGSQLQLSFCLGQGEENQCQSLPRLLVDRDRALGPLSRFYLRNGQPEVAARLIQNSFLLPSPPETLQIQAPLLEKLPTSTRLAMRAMRERRRGDLPEAGVWASRALYQGAWAELAGLASGLGGRFFGISGGADQLSWEAVSSLCSLMADAWPESGVWGHQLALALLPSNLAAHRAVRDAGAIAVRSARVERGTEFWQGPRAGQLWSNDTVAMKLRFLKGAGQLELEMKGTPSGGEWPLALVRWNGQRLANVTVDSLEARVYRFTVACREGENRLEVSFLNDGSAGGEDRNLFLGAVALQSGSGGQRGEPGALGGGSG